MYFSGGNRIGFKILNTILIQRYSNCMDGSLDPKIGCTRPDRFDQFMSDKENLVKTQILGNDFNPSQWYFPTKKNQSPKKVGEL